MEIHMIEVPETHYEECIHIHRVFNMDFFLFFSFYLVSCTKSWITHSCRDKFHKQVLYFSHAVPYVEQTLLKNTQGGNIYGHIKAKNFTKVTQELHYHETIRKRASIKNEAWDARQLWERLESKEKM